MPLDILTVAEVAEALGCEPERVSVLASGGHLPAVKYGRSWKFPIAALNKFLADKAMENLNQYEPVSPGDIPIPGRRGRPRKPPIDFTDLVRVVRK